MLSYLTELSENNNPPSDSIIRKVKEALIRPRQELEETRTEIQCLENLLADLKEKEGIIQNSIEEHVTILCPTRRFPPDILEEIFYHCLPDHRNPIMSTVEAPMVLTRICSAWRSLALSSPRLWARLHISFSDEYQTGSWGRGVDVMRKLDMRCDVVKEWLSRSGTCPLSISIYYLNRSWIPITDEAEEGDLTAKLFRSILPFVHRWGNIELIMSFPVYRKLQALLPPAATMPMLTSLRESLSQPPDLEAVQDHGISLLGAPNLKRLSFTGMQRLWNFNDTTLAWGRLTYLSCHSPFEITGAFALLKACPHLVHCKLHIFDFTPRWQVLPDEALQGLARLPHLQSLCITEQVVLEAATVLYDHIDTPQLRWIDYDRASYTPTQAQLIDKTISSPIFSLLQKSSELKKLTIEPQSILPWHMPIAFGLARRITHLVIGREPTRSVIPRLEISPSFQYSFDLACLTIDNSASSFSSLIREDILLPKLEILEAFLGASTSDETLLQFITSRMDPFSPLGIAVIKEVRIAFNRPKQLDVVGKVSQLAKSLGLKIKLNLDYLPFTSRIFRKGPCSPSFGLTPDDGSHTWSYNDYTWPYPDIDG